MILINHGSQFAVILEGNFTSEFRANLGTQCNLRANEWFGKRGNSLIAEWCGA